ncbi:MAG: Lrp/AsnC family transcriptional regulator [Erysipelotrichaceae bacterium]
MENLQLLKLIETNARYETKDLATMLELDEIEVQEELESLQQKKIVVGYHTLINWDKTHAAAVVAFIFVSAMPERNIGYDGVANKIIQFKEVDSLYLMSGGNEFVVIVKEATMQKIAHFVGSKLAPLDGVKGTTTHFVLKQYKASGHIFEKEEDRQERLLFKL